MKKYMGNKSKYVDFIYKAVEKVSTEKNKVIFDGFSGTTNVGRYFKSKGYEVITNDVNDFSYIFGKCYICNNGVPSFSFLDTDIIYSSRNFKKVINTKSFVDRKEKLVKENKNFISENFKKHIYDTRYLDVLVYLSYYASPADYDNNDDNFKKNKKMYDFIQRNYCENGMNSTYINQVYKKTLDNLKKKYNSSNDEKERLIDKFYIDFDISALKELYNLCIKNNEVENAIRLEKILKKNNLIGKRKFFSLDHAKRIDIILNTVCYWHNNNILNENEYEILLTAIIESVCIFSNTSATYQAFYKDYKSNTMQAFRLVIPELELEHQYGSSYTLIGDIFENINKKKYDILYLDPPYNWRQYDSNYHLLNTLAKLNDLNDIEHFEKGIVGASGENREYKLKYTSFYQKETFENRLFDLIKSSKCSLIVLSYSDSESNHRVKDIDGTLEKIESFFQDPSVFKVGSFKKFEHKRQNFESRKDNKKQTINELLFIAEKQ